MSDPYLPEFPFLYYFCDDRDPTESEPLLYNNYPDLLYIWKNKSTQDIFWCKSNATDSMIWHKMLDSNNAAAIIEESLPQDLDTSASPVFVTAQLSGLTASLPVGTDASKNLVSISVASFKSLLGLLVNTDRSASSITPPSFNSSRQPSTTHDVFVSANISFSAVLSLSAQVNIQLSTDNSSWVDYGKAKQQINLGATIIQQLSALVPAGSYYRFTLTGSGATIDSILETQL